jgi:hypothetical protein
MQLRVSIGTHSPHPRSGATQPSSLSSKQRPYPLPPWAALPSSPSSLKPFLPLLGSSPELFPRRGNGAGGAFEAGRRHEQGSGAPPVWARPCEEAPSSVRPSPATAPSGRGFLWRCARKRHTLLLLPLRGSRGSGAELVPRRWQRYGEEDVLAAVPSRRSNWSQICPPELWIWPQWQWRMRQTELG